MRRHLAGSCGAWGRLVWLGAPTALPPALPLPSLPQWVFTAMPGNFQQEVDAPDARFFGLTPNTVYTVNVECVTPGGKKIPSLQPLTFKTPTNG